ncbi:Putative flippase GtrA (transmembrane translocase of bactoprenol-linked glucose) [Geodermatophilus amargosae]|uniref:Putative flippase GtrA (Transmembrane translocase of bactoprenol-linked glucose) n=1 Tax=Geodermatophilus amargosae TaxID=1296565 RepID=A0A1I7CXV3_9ACTN|nr:GtrA family protein [Geodermatophilus amargosae]SFU04234.1 Putative flippase GtrA (transmembrane translocase of bactoprenol-linked glucose) [Geodermatophilus amargosae]
MSPAPSGSERFGELARFAVTGLAAYLTDVAVFNALLLGAELASTWAKVASSLVAIGVAFAGSRWFTWRHRRSSRIGREYARFFLVSLLAAGIQYFCLVITHHVLGWTSPLVDNLSANVVGMGLATAFRFWAFRTFVFPPGAASLAATDVGAQRGRVRSGGV